MRLWWQDEIAKLRALSGATAEEHAVLLALLWVIVVPVLLAFALTLAGATGAIGVS